MLPNTAAPRSYDPSGVAGSPTPVEYERAKAMAIFYGSSTAEATARALGKYRQALINWGLADSQVAMQNFVGFMRDEHETLYGDGNALEIFNYVNANEVDATWTTAAYGTFGGMDALATKAANENWWLKKVGFTFTADAGTDLLTFGSGNASVAYAPVTVGSTGTLPAPLVAGQVYWWIVGSTTTCKLATTRANAVAGTAIDITSTGSGTHSLYIIPQSYQNTGSVCDINRFSMTPTDAQGRRYHDYVAQFADYILTQGGARIDGFYMDTSTYYPSAQFPTSPSAGQANFLLDGVNRTGHPFASIDANLKPYMRVAHRAFIDALKAVDPTRKLVGLGQGSSDALSIEWHQSAEIDQQQDGVLAEYSGMLRVNTALLNNFGWDVMLARLQTYSDSVADTGSCCWLLNSLATTTDYQRLRFGLATAMLLNWWMMLSINDSYSQVPGWYDEFDARLGEPLEAAVQVSGSKWRRKYENGMVLVNGTSFDNGSDFVAAASPANDWVYTPTAGVYRHITATQDTTANPQSGGLGAIVNGSITIPPWDGRILLCVSEGVHT
jgi:hypothetical protein